MNTPCGYRYWDRPAMYCKEDHTIYMTGRYYAETEGQTRPGAFLGQFLHEFGHSLQNMAGISQAKTRARQERGGRSSPGGLEITRRNELQATCFEGMALAALQNGGMDNDYIRGAFADSLNRGDEYNNQPDHGSLASNKVWLERGFYDNRTARCNTWSAPSTEVD